MKYCQQIWEKIAHNIKEDILNGLYKPNERLKENELAARYEVSNTPVREALRYLDRIGFVKIIPRSGASVKGLTQKEIDNLFSIWVKLEELAAEEAVENLTDDNIRAMERQLEILENYYQAQDWQAYEKINEAFQEIIWNATQNDDLIEILQSIHMRVQRFQVLTRHANHHFGHTADERRKMFLAFTQRDWKVVRRLARKHYKKYHNTITNLLKEEKSADFKKK